MNSLPSVQRSHDLLDLFRPPTLPMTTNTTRSPAHTRAHALSLPQLPSFPSSFVARNNSLCTPENWDEDFDFEEQTVEQLLGEEEKKKTSRRPSVRRRRGISVPVNISQLQGNVIEDLGHMQNFVTIIEELKSLRETRDSLAHQLSKPTSPAAHAFLQSTRSDWECAEVMIEIASDPESVSASPSIEPESDISLPPPTRQADILRDILSTSHPSSLDRRWSSSTGPMCPSLSASSSSSSASSTYELDIDDNELIFSVPTSPLNESCTAWDGPAYELDEKKIRFGADTLPGLVHYMSELQSRLRRGLVELKSLTV